MFDVYEWKDEEEKFSNSAKAIKKGIQVVRLEKKNLMALVFLWET